MITTMLFTLVVTTSSAQQKAELAYPKDPKQNIAIKAQSRGMRTPATRTTNYPKDIRANLAAPATGTPVASQQFKLNLAYPKDPRANLARP